jgi:hypothetical protein
MGGSVMSDEYVPFDLKASLQEMSILDMTPANPAKAANLPINQGDVAANSLLICANLPPNIDNLLVTLAQISKPLARANALKQNEISRISRISRPSMSNGDFEDTEDRGIPVSHEGGFSSAAVDALARHRGVVGLPPCPQCGALAYRYEDNFVRCTAMDTHAGTPPEGEKYG